MPSKRAVTVLLIIGTIALLLIGLRMCTRVKVQSILLREDTGLSSFEKIVVGEAVMESALRYRLDPILVLAVMKVESHFKPDAVSPAGARGLMQLQAVAALEVGKKGTTEELRQKLEHDNVFNIEVGCAYLRFLLNKYDGNRTRSLAAYNLGPSEEKRLYGNKAHETAYVQRVMKTYEKML